MTKYSAIAALFMGSLMVGAPVYAQTSTSTAPTAADTKQKTDVDSKQKTDGENVTGNANFPAANGSYAKQKTDGEDVTGNSNFPAAAGSYSQPTRR